jgi:hypothetical protein
VSSTTERKDERGQILVLFALGIFVILLAATMAFDVGMVLVEKRDQQNAADAAALAGARFLPDDTTAARDAAEDMADRNGFDDGVNSANVVVNIPPANGAFAGRAGFIEVIITANRPSVFAGVIGRNSWGVGSRAVAANQDEEAGPFAMLALHPTACPALRIEGSGVVNSNGNIQVNSACVTGDRAFRIAGTGTLNLTAENVGCNLVGGWTQGGGIANNDCNPPNTPAAAIPDPYELLADPPIPNDGATPPNIVYPTRPAQVAGSTMTIPTGCPDGDPVTPATDASPVKCVFGGSYAGTTWRLYPGYYPGGIDLRGGTIYMEPGIYYMAGGGFRTAGGTVAVTSVYAGGDSLCDPSDPADCGGVLIFNGEHATAADGPVILQGGDSGVNLYPLRQGTPWDSMVVFQDRDITLGVQIEGGSSDMQVRGIVYAPSANVSVRGNAGTVTLDQVIASTFEIRGNGGTINVEYDATFLPDFTGAGLVE